MRRLQDFEYFVNEAERRRGVKLSKELNIGGEKPKPFFFQDAEMQDYLTRAKKIEISVCRQTRLRPGVIGQVEVYDANDQCLYDGWDGGILEYFSVNKIWMKETTVKEVCTKVFGSVDEARALIDKGVQILWMENEEFTDLKTKIDDPSDYLEFGDDYDT